MADTECGWCGRLAHMPAASGLFYVPPRDGAEQLYQAAYQCPNCRKLNLATGPCVSSNGMDQSVSSADQYTWSKGIDWMPQLGDSRAFPDVPPQIASAATEATLCMSIGAYRAVGALARAVIEATAKHKKAEGRDLYARIEALAAADHIRSHTKAQAHEVRHFGNEMAHGDFAEEVAADEAAEIIELMSEILAEVYQSPARLARRKEARLAKQPATE